jgi:hypothetical protein
VLGVASVDFESEVETHKRKIQEYIDQTMFEKLRDSALALSCRISKFITYLQTYPKNQRTRRC